MFASRVVINYHADGTFRRADRGTVGQASRQADEQTGRQTNKQTYTMQTDRFADRETEGRKVEGRQVEGRQAKVKYTLWTDSVRFHSG